ncbi:hypothetical protein TheveDRAFT_1485 [Thermanaerovibrio velox DSM 12556]|uniref:Uncharacterized protein n=1 Tax=Thermanaerovibrio velox DSM 12556 TaxID=926567 RepID=H0UPH2_9BACT|nr:hypothetical protein TheveDRAFT_1485 [Thermanaerovibrio velox DSM 12556]
MDWYVKDLMAYMFGVPREELDSLVEGYQASGGVPDPSGLFRYLSANGRKYRVLWAVFPMGDLISILFAAVFGPDKQMLWRKSSVLPMSSDSGALRLWNRVLELSSGIGVQPDSRVSETDLWSAEQVNRQLMRLWDGWAGMFLTEVEEWLSQQGIEVPDGMVESSELNSRLSVDISKDIRDSVGRSVPLGSVRYAVVSLPELRDMGLEVSSLQSVLDSYVSSAIPSMKQDPQSGGEDAAIPQGVLEVRPCVDPINGVALSLMRPGDPVVVEPAREVELPGTIYMIRLLKNGQYEVHGQFDRDGSFFKFISPGELKIKIPPGVHVEDREGFPVLYAAAAGLLALLAVALYIYR